jgi:NADH-dependent peroxiredoxin subunit F
VRDLSEYANKLYLLVRSEKIKGDPITYEKIKNNPKVEIISMSEAQEILGDNFVSGLKYLDKKSGEAKQLEVGGVFVEIGAVPNVEFLGDLVEKNKFNEITVNCETQETSRPGIWAAGDASSVRYKQNNISAGDAVKAVLNIYDYLHRNNK